MNTHRNRLTACIACLLFVFFVSTTAYAHAVPDMNRRCSVTLLMRDGTDMVSGGSLVLYRVGEIVEDDGNYTFRSTGDFSACGESFDNLDSSADMAIRLQTYAQQNSAADVASQTINDQGEAAFADLQAGLYLVVQRDASPGYEKISPFLIALPYLENGTYCYDLTAEPKTELKKETETSPDDPQDNPPKLPQTGQLWWPVPVLACAGLLFFVVGVLLNRRQPSDGD